MYNLSRKKYARKYLFLNFNSSLLLHFIIVFFLEINFRTKFSVENYNFSLLFSNNITFLFRCTLYHQPRPSKQACENKKGRSLKKIIEKMVGILCATRKATSQYCLIWKNDQLKNWS